MKLSTTPLSLTEISDCIKNWEKIRTTYEGVKMFLNAAPSYVFQKSNPEQVENFHVYPGVHPETNACYIFLISEDKDKKQDSKKELYDAIIQCPLGQFSNTPPDTIPEKEALHRIESWAKNRLDWAKIQMKSATGMFMAYNMPASYVQTDVKYETFFALKDKEDAPDNRVADLVTVEYEAVHKVFYDVVRPVPPFDFAPMSSFYLLTGDFLGSEN
ncbi:hypothetical protein G5B10_12285 [Fluviicola sp. SGL-29]|nr:hypothetical protein [Fluviicola sp. SGL-29]